MYPVVSNWLAESNQSGVIQKYEQDIAVEDETFYDEEWAKAQEYNETLAGDPVRDPFIPGTGYALPENYLDCLNIDGVMGYIEIPKIDVRLPIYHGTSEEVLQKGVGHIESTALPIGGDFTHSVLTGHRGLPSAELFTNLDQVEIGDRFYIYVLNKVLAYEVDEINTVLPYELEQLQALKGRDMVTLITCTPYGVNTHRLLVRGTRTEYIPEEAEMDRQTARVTPVLGLDVRMQYLGIAVGMLILIVVIVIIFFSTGKGRRRGLHEAKRK